ncbi:uncharacterized protein LOC122501126 [Leptopilina heterotoma]|uniref:uncharacterized protein LOC122501126 n=1 Tax=Leptopilina heterotoma TaxID=63436 RepID=UPI001CA8B3B7|nr:uncharacterized protein LOC122501126 [Leptopilina heterotoma]
MLNAAKGMTTLPSWITCLAKGYWLPEQFKFVASRRPKSVSQKDFVEIKFDDVNNIIKILRSLQEIPQYKLVRVKDKQINFKDVRCYIQEATKNERKKIKKGNTVTQEEEEIEDNEVLGDNESINEDESINENDEEDN